MWESYQLHITGELGYDGPLYDRIRIWRTICLLPVRCISSIRHMYTTDFAYDGPIFLVPLSPSYPSSPVHDNGYSKHPWILLDAYHLKSFLVEVLRSLYTGVIWNYDALINNLRRIFTHCLKEFVGWILVNTSLSNIYLIIQTMTMCSAFEHFMNGNGAI